MVSLCLLHLSISNFACLFINSARTREVLEKGMFEIRHKIQMNKISQYLALKTCSTIACCASSCAIHPLFPKSHLEELLLNLLSGFLL